jgi:hypothetical protein
MFIIIRRYNLKHDFEISNAIVTSAGKRMDKSGNWLVEYQYKTKDGKKFQGEAYLPLLMLAKDSFIGKTIPVAYYRDDQDVNELLIYKHTWKQYKLEFPDSLNWVSRFIDESKVIYSY